MPYPKGPYAYFDALPVLPRPKIGAARNIDFARGRYINDATTGGFEHMPPIVQRVIILAAKVPVPKFNTLRDRNRYKRDLENAISPLAEEYPPLIGDLVVTVEPEGPDKASKFVTFRDLSDQRSPIREVQLP